MHSCLHVRVDSVGASTHSPYCTGGDVCNKLALNASTGMLTVTGVPVVDGDVYVLASQVTIKLID
jgi:hypothetical protein